MKHGQNNSGNSFNKNRDFLEENEDQSLSEKSGRINNKKRAENKKHSKKHDDMKRDRNDSRWQ